jgi:opacity protein-like surface antigen
MRKTLLSLLTLTLLLCPALQAQTTPAAAPATPMRWDIGLRLSSLVAINAKDSYDAVFGGTMLRYGAQVEMRPTERFLLSLAVETGSKTGERVLPTNPPFRTGVDEKLTLTPIHLSAAWIFHPEATVNWYAGLGPTFLNWKDSSAGESNSGSDIGAHLLGGVRWQSSGRWSIGGEVRYSTVPNAVGKGGITKIYNEDDLGGFSLSLVSLWRIH